MPGIEPAKRLWWNWLPAVSVWDLYGTVYWVLFVPVPFVIGLLLGLMKNRRIVGGLTLIIAVLAIVTSVICVMLSGYLPEPVLEICMVIGGITSYALIGIGVGSIFCRMFRKRNNS